MKPPSVIMTIVMLFGVGIVTAIVPPLIMGPQVRESKAKAAKFDEVCRHVTAYLQTRGDVLRGADPREAGLRARIAGETPAYAPIRWCVDFPDDRWLACTTDSCRAAVLFELAPLERAP